MGSYSPEDMREDPTMDADEAYVRHRCDWRYSAEHEYQELEDLAAEIVRAWRVRDEDQVDELIDSGLHNWCQKYHPDWQG